MDLKIIFLACLMMYLCDAAKNDSMKQLLDDVCKDHDTKECRESAKKCLAPHHEKTPAELKEWKMDYCKCFQTCLDKVAGSKAVYQTYIREQHRGDDWCSEGYVGTEHKESHKNAQPEGKKIQFTDYLAQVSGAKAAADFTCCLAQEKGMFDAHGKPIVAAWKEGAAAIVDPAAKAAYVAGIDSCAASNPVCSHNNFQLCAVKKCCDAVKAVKAH